MTGWLRRVRAMLTIGALWGAGAATLGAIGVGAATLLAGLPLSPALLRWAGTFGVIGFVLGSGFGSVLTLLEHRRSIGELTLGRVAILGALVGAAAPLAVGLWGFVLEPPGSSFEVFLRSVLPSSLLVAGLGAAAAAGTLSVARRAPELSKGEPHQAHIPESSRDGLSAGEGPGGHGRTAI